MLDQLSDLKTKVHNESQCSSNLNTTHPHIHKFTGGNAIGNQ